MSLSSINTSEVRKFGAVCFIVSTVLISTGIWREKNIPVFIGLMFLIAGVFAVFIPQKFKPFYRSWKRAAFVISKCITAVILSIAYYLVITPSALIKKMSGGAPLNIKLKRSEKTYWVARDEPVQPKHRYSKRF